MSLAGLQAVVERLAQRGVAAHVVVGLGVVATSFGSLGAVVEYFGIVETYRIGAHVLLHLIVNGEHLVVVAQLAPRRGNCLAPVEGLTVLALLEKRKVFVSIDSYSNLLV